jgi:hypothetical protein
MKSKRAFLVIFVLAALLAGLFWSLNKRVKPQQPAAGSQTANRKSEQAALRSTNALSNSYSKGVQIAIAAGVPLPTNSAQSREDWMKQAREYTQAQLQQSSWRWRMPIEFYGKVVDEHLAPVAGAGITIERSDLSSTGTSETNLVSGADGRFELRGVTGKGISVYVEKRGYYYARKSNQHSFEYADDYDPRFYRPDPANPVIFQLRKIGEGVDLITSRYGVRPDLGVPVPKNGNLVKVDFLERKVGTSGQMEVQNWIEPKDRSINRNSWKFRLAIPDGGFVPHNEEFAFMAPATGYEPELVFNFPKEMTNGWASGFRTNYYIRFGNPPRYGRIEATLDGIYGGMSLEYTINPDGGRYLEPKPKTYSLPNQPQ